MNKGLNENIETIAKMFFEELKPLRQIGNELGISGMAVQKALKRHGYDTGKKALNLDVTCELCNKKFTRNRARVRKAIQIFCSDECYYEYLKIINEQNTIDRYGQILSRKKMEKIYGELPDKSIVHHIDGDDTNTSIINLMLLKSQSDHIKIHRNYGTPEILFDGGKLKYIYPSLTPEEIENKLLEKSDVKKIIVNAKEKIITEDLLSYSDILKLADLPYEKSYSMTFRKCLDKSEGILTFKESVKVKNGSIFNVSMTGNA